MKASEIYDDGKGLNLAKVKSWGDQRSQERSALVSHLVFTSDQMLNVGRAINVIIICAVSCM